MGQYLSWWWRRKCQADHPSHSSQFADLSTLDLGNIDESTDELDRVLSVSSTDKLGQPNIYYTMDSRRLANKHKKNQLDRCGQQSNFVQKKKGNHENFLLKSEFIMRHQGLFRFSLSLYCRNTFFSSL